MSVRTACSRAQAPHTRTVTPSTIIHSSAGPPVNFYEWLHFCCLHPQGSSLSSLSSLFTINERLKKGGIISQGHLWPTPLHLLRLQSNQWCKWFSFYFFLSFMEWKTRKNMLFRNLSTNMELSAAIYADRSPRLKIMNNYSKHSVTV